MNLRAWFDLARRVVSLTVQLDARTGELRAALKTVEYWKQIAGSRWDEVCRLNADVNEARAAAVRGHARELLPSAASVPLGSRDRANLHRLTDENERLRALVEQCEKEHR